jgi:hypothetical protein
MIKMKWLHSMASASLILDEMAMLELLQRDATRENLADALVAIMMDSPARQRQCDAFARLDAIMEIGAAVPSERVAAAVLAMAKSHGSPRSQSRARPKTFRRARRRVWPRSPYRRGQETYRLAVCPRLRLKDELGVEGRSGVPA